MRPHFAALALVLATTTAKAAPPLATGDIVVAGYTYAGQPAGACPDAVCRVDPVTGVTTPISGPLPDPATTGYASDIAIESRASVLVLLHHLGSGTVLRLDVTTGALSTLVASFETQLAAEIVVAPGGRIFALGRNDVGIVEIDATSGAVSVFAPSNEYIGLGLEPSGSLLTTRFWGCGFPCFQQYDEFVRIDTGTAAATPLGALVPGFTTYLLPVTADSRVSFARTGIVGDGRVWLATSGGSSTITGGEDTQGNLTGLALEPSGHLLIGGLGHPDDFQRLIEITRWNLATKQNIAAFDQDYGVFAIAAVPAPACADGVDNDGDTLADFPADPGCKSAESLRENPQCNDGVDNDGDLAIDHPADTRCRGAWDNDEASDPVSCGLGAELALALLLLRRWRADAAANLAGEP